MNCERQTGKSLRMPVHFVRGKFEQPCSFGYVWNNNILVGAFLSFKHFGSTTRADFTCAAPWPTAVWNLPPSWLGDVACSISRPRGWSEAAGSVTLTHMTFDQEKLPEALHTKNLLTPLLWPFQRRNEIFAHSIHLFMPNDLHPFYSNSWLAVNVFDAFVESDVHPLKSQVRREKGSEKNCFYFRSPVSTGHMSPVICH